MSWADDTMWKEELKRWGIKDYNEKAIVDFTRNFDTEDETQMRVFAYYAFKGCKKWGKHELGGRFR